MTEPALTSDVRLAAMRDQVTVVIPTLDEEEAIGPLIDEVKAAGYGNVLVVDGYSNDRTVEIAKGKGAVVLGQHGKGKSGAVLVARDVVKTPYFILMDGDYSYDPHDIDKFIIHANEYDQIIGFRPKRNPNIPRLHRFGNWLLTTTFNLLMGSNIPDVACGMYLLRTQTAKQLIIDVQGLEVDHEIAAQVYMTGTITYVPINYRPRLGKTKVLTWRQGIKSWTTVVSSARRHNPVVFFGLFVSIALFPAVILLGYAGYLYLVFRSYHSGFFLASLMLFVIGGQGLTLATVGYMLRRMERRLSMKSNLVYAFLRRDSNRRYDDKVESPATSENDVAN